jgi:hypothetical protein
MRRFVPLLIAIMAVMLIAPASVSANNDPHRDFMPAAPFDLPAGFCAFPVHVAFPVNREYATTSTLRDGSTVVKVTGSSFMSVTNLDTGKMITVNVSSSGTFTYPPDGLTFSITVHGPSWFASDNPKLTDFGLPSNFVVITGLAHVTVDMTTGEFLSFTGPYSVHTDVCAALS